MTYTIQDKKWILYRHTRNFDLITAVAIDLKNNAKSVISQEEKARLLMRLRENNFYKERNPDKPLDAINHRINTLAYFMFGYKGRVGNKRRFLFSPLGNLFLKHVGDLEKIKKIFLTMLWAVQFEHPEGGTTKEFQLYPFRLIFKLLSDKRLDYKLYAFEVEYLVVFTRSIDDESYEKLVHEILKIRAKKNEEIEQMFKKRRHVMVNAAHEWDYYLSKLFRDVGLLNRREGEVICKLQHGNTRTFRKITRNFVSINDSISDYLNVLLENYPYDEKPLRLDDSERLKKDVIKEIYSFYPKELLREIGELEDNFKAELLELPKLIERYSNNNNSEEAYLFEDVLVKGFNMFVNVIAERIGGPGNTDIECLFTKTSEKFAVDAKSTKNKLLNLNSGRLNNHREKIGGLYTIVVTPRYVPAVKIDIKGSKIVIIRASTFAEYLYNCINYNHRDIDYTEIHKIILNNLGKDISNQISEITMRKFSIS